MSHYIPYSRPPARGLAHSKFRQAGRGGGVVGDGGRFLGEELLRSGQPGSEHQL